VSTLDHLIHAINRLTVAAWAAGLMVLIASVIMVAC
jgi:hypothetical protein